MDCGVCYESFNENEHKPKILPCGHTFCSKCLQSLAQRHKDLLPCPICKGQHTINDVSQLTTNFSILNLKSVFQNISAKEKGPDVSAGYCDGHGEHKLFLCKSCDVWICHVCTVTEHPTDKCDVVSIKIALMLKKNKMRSQLLQSIKESEKMLDHLEKEGSELQYLDDAQKHIISEQEQIQAKCKELVDDACKDLSSTKDKGVTIIKSFLELNDDLIDANKLQEVAACAQKICDISERAQEWMEGAGDNASWKSVVAHVRNLQMISNFSLEFTQAMATLSRDQMEAIISKTRDIALLSSESIYVAVEVDSETLFAKVSPRTMTSAVLSALDKNSPPPDASIIQLADLMAKFSLAYVEVKTLKKQLHLPLVQDSKGCFWMECHQDVSLPSHCRYLLIPLMMLLRSNRVRFKHWSEESFSNLHYIRNNSDSRVVTYLSSFRCQHPQEGSFILTADVVATLCHFVIVYFDLKWDGKLQDTFAIELNEGAKSSFEFQLLCSGDYGHSYCVPRPLAVANRGSPGEMVTVGDYLGRSLLPDLQPENVKGRPVYPGLVASKPNSSQFVIYTGDLPDATDPLSFGRVIRGLDVLREALEVEDIRDVSLHRPSCRWYFDC